MSKQGTASIRNIMAVLLQDREKRLSSYEYADSEGAIKPFTKTTSNGAKGNLRTLQTVEKMVVKGEESFTFLTRSRCAP